MLVKAVSPLRTDLFVGTLPEDGHEVDGSDRRREVVGNGLDIRVDLIALRHLNDRNQTDSDRDDEDDGRSVVTPWRWSTLRRNKYWSRDT